MDHNSDDVNFRAPFLGLIAGTFLLGVTMLKAWQYFLHYPGDSRKKKVTVCAVCLLDFLHFGFSVTMIYSSLTSSKKCADPKVLWSWKAMVIAKALLTILVQGFYLQIVWVLAGSIVMRTIYRAFSISVLTYAIGLVVAFCAYLREVSRISSFPKSFENGAGTTKRGKKIITCLVIFFGGTGALTAIFAVTSMSLYTASKSSLLYLATELWVSRIYAISILTLYVFTFTGLPGNKRIICRFNSKSYFKKALEGTVEISIPSALVFPNRTQEDNVRQTSHSQTPATPAP
ncbi:hypothetical protein D9613_006482 [Agrocybe pediades]|uniref:Uncharacterized protein n=1 Tax=Agrocybe pediades TaxID=84607 RepID=A0A8H4VJW9_9AGAR|nr:hypothetical protein D9613_006482 [Agrocybe pediades]